MSAPARAATARTLNERELRRLHFINALFSHITAHDLYLAAQIKDAIAFSLDELAAKNAPSDEPSPISSGKPVERPRNENQPTPPPPVPDGAPASAPQNKSIEDAPFYDAAARLLKTAFAHHFPERGFYHWDAAQSLASATPLFARDEILIGLRHLAPYRESTLLITNLRPALIPAAKRATPRRAEAYRELVDFIRQLAATHSTPSSTLQLLFL